MFNQNFRDVFKTFKRSIVERGKSFLTQTSKNKEKKMRLDRQTNKTTLLWFFCFQQKRRTRKKKNQNIVLNINLCSMLNQKFHHFFSAQFSSEVERNHPILHKKKESTINNTHFKTKENVKKKKESKLLFEYQS